MFGELTSLCFTYSKSMEIALFFVTIIGNLLLGLIITNLVLKVYKENASTKQKIIFSFFCSVLLNTLTIYITYAIIGFRSFTSLEYALVVTPDPIYALLMYGLGVKVLKLSKYRSLHYNSMLYLCSLVIAAISQILGNSIFSQPPGPHNYLIDILSIISGLLITYLIYRILIFLLKRRPLSASVPDSLFVKSIPKTLFSSFAINCLAFSFFIIVPPLFTSTALGYFFVMLCMILSLVISYYRVSSRAKIIEMQNLSAHISSLSSTLDDFSGLKHDFYNILQTYSGYIQLGNLNRLKNYHEQLCHTTIMAGEQLDLNERYDQNPAFISLLLEKQKYARELGAWLRVNLRTDINDFYIDNMCLCRSLACLIDNAVEAAAESEEKSVTITVKKKRNSNILIVISNSTKTDVDLSNIAVRGATTKENHSGLGVSQARNTLDAFGNCILQYEYYNLQLTVYIEICPAD